MNYTADIHRDFIFDGFGPVPGVPDSHGEHGLDLLSDSARDIIPVVAPDLNPEQVALPKDGGVDPAPQAAYSSAVEPNTCLTFVEAGNPGPRTRIRLQVPVRALPNPLKLVGLR